MTDCSKCDGKGKVMIGYLQRDSPVDVSLIPCPKCKGKGHD